MDRRKFITTAARRIVIAGFGAAAILGFRRSKISLDAQGVCPVNPSCSSCGRFAQCTSDLKSESTEATMSDHFVEE